MGKKKKFIISAQEANKLNHKNQYNSTIRKNYAPEKSVQEKKIIEKVVNRLETLPYNDYQENISEVKIYRKKK
jgi:hypothetical protein